MLIDQLTMVLLLLSDFTTLPPFHTGSLILLVCYSSEPEYFHDDTHLSGLRLSPYPAMTTEPWAHRCHLVTMLSGADPCDTAKL